MAWSVCLWALGNPPTISAQDPNAGPGGGAMLGAVREGRETHQHGQAWAGLGCGSLASKEHRLQPPAPKSRCGTALPPVPQPPNPARPSQSPFAQSCFVGLSRKEPLAFRDNLRTTNIRCPRLACFSLPHTCLPPHPERGCSDRVTPQPAWWMGEVEEGRLPKELTEQAATRPSEPRDPATS